MTEEKGTAFTLQMVTLFCGVDDHMEITVMSWAGVSKNSILMYSFENWY